MSAAMKWGFVVMVEEAHPFATVESIRGLATRMLEQLKSRPQLIHLRAGVGYTVVPPRLIHVARVFGAVDAADENEEEAILSRSVPAAVGVGDRKTTLYFWPAR